MWEPLKKRNFGIPATILVVFSYLIGYSLTLSLSNLFVAILFAGLVFIFNFDSRIKTAVKQSYGLATCSILIGLIFKIFYLLINIGSSGESFFSLRRIINSLYSGIEGIFTIAVIIIYLLYIIFAVSGKDIKIALFNNIFDEKAPKPTRPVQPIPQQVYQQPQQKMQSQPPLQSQKPVNSHQLVQSQFPQSQVAAEQLAATKQPSSDDGCPTCGINIQEGAIFCANCGRKL